MNTKGFTENTENIETPNDINVSEKPLNPNKISSGRVDINVLKSKLEAQQGKELRKNIFIFSFCILLLGLLENVKLEINNLGDEQTRTSYSEALVKFLKNQKDELDEDTQRKLIENPLRILDSKSKTIQDLLDKAPSIEDFINEDSKKFNMKFLEILETHGIEYEVNPKLGRGLDY